MSFMLQHLGSFSANYDVIFNKNLIPNIAMYTIPCLVQSVIKYIVKIPAI